MPQNRNSGAGPLLAAAASLLLLVSLFLDWFGDGDDGITAWTVFEVWDLVLAAIALLALWRAAHSLGAVRNGHGVPFWALGGAALVIVASQLINHPPLVQFDGVDHEVGAWLALVAALLLLISGLLNRVRLELVDDGTPAPSPHVPAPSAPATPPPASGPGAATPPTEPTRPIH